MHSATTKTFLSVTETSQLMRCTEVTADDCVYYNLMVKWTALYHQALTIGRHVWSCSVLGNGTDPQEHKNSENTAPTVRKRNKVTQLSQTTTRLVHPCSSSTSQSQRKGRPLCPASKTLQTTSCSPVWSQVEQACLRVPYRFQEPPPARPQNRPPTTPDNF
jgi:hypothetical protein